jgi:hypothetical protein
MPRNKLIEQWIELLSGVTVHYAFVILEIIAVGKLRRLDPRSVRYEQASSLAGRLFQQKQRPPGSRPIMRIGLFPTYEFRFSGTSSSRLQLFD